MYVLLFSFFFSIAAYSQDNPILYFPSEGVDLIKLDSFIQFIDFQNEDIAQKSAVELHGLTIFTKSAEDSIRTDQVQWCRINIRNSSPSAKPSFLSFSRHVDSMHVYELRDSNLFLIYKLNQNSRAKENYLFTNRSLAALTILPEQNNIFYFKIFPQTKERLARFSRGFVLEKDHSLFNKLIKSRSLTFLAEGVLLLMVLISLLLLISFRSIDFLYFALFILLSIFIVGSDVGIISGYFTPLNKAFMLGEEAIISTCLYCAGLVMVITLFIDQQLNLKTYWPKFRRVYFIIAFLFVAICFYVIVDHVFLYDPHSRKQVLVFFAFILWTPLNLVPIIQGLVKKRTSAIVLFTAFSFMTIVPLIVSTTTNFSMTKASSLTLYFLLPFFGTLMYGIIDRINKIQKERLNFRIEKEKSEALLYNILPEEVATELKEKGESKAKLINEVSVLFTDFEGFTEKSSQLSPDMLVAELNVCFKAFDDIIEQHQIEKIKTIGDAYMAAGGLATDNAFQATKQAIKSAIEMQAFIQSRKEQNIVDNKAYFEMRVGIHTGPIVAGVVGVKKFQYDIWGDTVNTASRMESHGEVGKVNISGDTYQLVKEEPEFQFTSRGKVKAKGKGEMDMWFVEYV